MNNAFECIDEKDLYKIIFNKINKDADEAFAEAAKKGADAEHLKQFKRYNYINKLGFKTKQYYTIAKFVRGEKLDNGMAKPLSQNNLIKLIKSLGIKFVKTMYLVQF